MKGLHHDFYQTQITTDKKAPAETVGSLEVKMKYENMRYKVGNTVKGKTNTGVSFDSGTVLKVNPTSAIPYLVELSSGISYWCYERDLSFIADEPKNHMADVAELLGQELNVDFNIIDAECNPYQFTEDGLIDRCGDDCDYHLTALLCGDMKIEKLPWKPEYGEVFFYVMVNGEIHQTRFAKKCTAHHSYLSLGNCFHTQKEAEANKKVVKPKLGLDEWVK